MVAECMWESCRHVARAVDAGYRYQKCFGQTSLECGSEHVQKFLSRFFLAERMLRS